MFSATTFLELCVELAIPDKLLFAMRSGCKTANSIKTTWCDRIVCLVLPKYNPLFEEKTHLLVKMSLENSTSFVVRRRNKKARNV